MTGIIIRNGDSFMMGSSNGSKMEIFKFLAVTKRDEINELVNNLYDLYVSEQIQNKIKIRQTNFFLNLNVKQINWYR